MNAADNTFDISTLRGRTYATIRAAFNKTDELMFEHGDLGNTNISSILTLLIRECGRFNERYSSDALYNMDNLRDIASKKSRLDSPFDEIFMFGIRQDGVDYGDYIMKHLADSRRGPNDYVYPSQRYRKIYAVRVRVFYEQGLSTPRCEFSLRNLSNSFLTLDPADLDADGYKFVQFPTGNLISREPADEKHRIDKVDIDKAKEAGYQRFSLQDVDPESLVKDGCTSDVTCQEIRAYWDNPIIPENQDKGHPICRIYRFGDNPGAAVVWLDDWYRHYSNVTGLIIHAVAEITGGA